MTRTGNRDGKMRRRATGVLAAVTLAWLAAGAVHAEDYAVEVIVFRHTAPQVAGAWASDEALPDFAAARRLIEPDDAAPAGDHATGSAPGPAAFTALPPTSFRLAGAEKLLAASTAYEVITHAAWQQPGDAGIAVYIGDPAQTGADAAATTVPSAVETGGVLAVAPSRARAEGTLRLQVALPEMRVQSDFVVLAGEAPVRVKATRNLKSGELHYLDHELLGILLQVTSLAPESPADGGIVAPNADVPEETFND